MNTILKNRLKTIKLKRGYYNASILDLSNFEYKWKAEICPNCGKEKNCFVLPCHIDHSIQCVSCFENSDYKFSHDTNHGIASLQPIPSDMPKEYNLSLHMPKESIDKLLHTPEFTSIQGGIWLDHCNDFMEFIGIWEPKDFTMASNSTGLALFNRMTDEDSSHLWSMFELDENETKSTWDDVQYYSFKCSKCNKLKGYWDMG